MQNADRHSPLLIVRGESRLPRKHLRIKFSFRAPRGATPFLWFGHTCHPSYRRCFLDRGLVFFREFRLHYYPCCLIAGCAWSPEKAASCDCYPPLVLARQRGPLEHGRVCCFVCGPLETCRRALGVFHKPWENRGQVPAFCLLYTSPSPRDGLLSRMPSSA